MSDAGLHAHGIGIDFENVAKVLAEVDDQSGAERLAGQSRASATRNQRDALLLRVAHQAADVFLIARQDDTGRLHLKDARIRAIQTASDIVETNIALEEAMQIILESAQVHGSLRGQESAVRNQGSGGRR